MSEKEFFEWLKSQPIEDYIVCVEYKYDHEKDYTRSNELLIWDNEVNGGQYVWLNDWWEGQQDVTILASIAIADLDILLLQTFIKLL